MNHREFVECMAVLEVATGKALKKNQAKIWFECLSDLTIKQLQQGIVGYLRNGDDWPSIAKLRRFALPGNAVDPETRADRAWIVVGKSIRTVGGYRTQSVAGECLPTSRPTK